MPEATTTPTTSRRSALRGFGLAAIAAGLAVPAAASSAEADDDAELIRLCAEVVTLKPRFDALHRVRKTVEVEKRTEPELSALYAREAELVKQIERAVPPTTLAGARALAGASLSLSMLDEGGEPYFEGGDSEYFGLTIVQFLTRGEVA